MEQGQIKDNGTNKIEVYSDGSGNTFDSDGGYGYYITLNDLFLEEGSGYLNSATNNVAECLGAINGLKAAKQYINTNQLQNVNTILISDSQLVLGYASGKYQCKALHLTQLYIQLRQLYKELNCEQLWVKGHSGNPGNERCDKLAKAAREGKGNGVDEETKN